MTIHFTVIDDWLPVTKITYVPAPTNGNVTLPATARRSAANAPLVLMTLTSYVPNSGKVKVLREDVGLGNTVTSASAELSRASALATVANKPRWPQKVQPAAHACPDP